MAGMRWAALCAAACLWTSAADAAVITYSGTVSQRGLTTLEIQKFAAGTTINSLSYAIDYTARAGFATTDQPPFTVNYTGTAGFGRFGLVDFMNSVPIADRTFSLVGRGSVSGILTQGLDFYVGEGVTREGFVSTFNLSGVNAFRVNSQDSATYTLTFDFTPSIPEPSTWALMLAGFGMAGYALRRRRVAVLA